MADCCDDIRKELDLLKQEIEKLRRNPCGTGKTCKDKNYCPPGMVCIEAIEYAEIKSLIG